jgi:hypothetical protein
MQRNRRGDCGEYAWLFAAWCRSIGIPARVLLGSWAVGWYSAHAWNEFYLEGVGWIPVDGSHTALARRNPLRISGRLVSGFGHIAGTRIIFSVDCELPPVPAYPSIFAESDHPKQPKTFKMTGRSFRWGQDSLNGALPYLQPAYPCFTSPPKRRQQGLGRWLIHAKGWRAAPHVGFGIILISWPLWMIFDLVDSSIGGEQLERMSTYLWLVLALFTLMWGVAKVVSLLRTKRYVERG